MIKEEQIKSLALEEKHSPRRRNYKTDGSNLLSERIQLFSTKAAKKHKTNFIQMGGYDGKITAVLAKIAKLFDRKLIVFEWAFSENGSVQRSFKSNIKPFKDQILFIQDDPSSPDNAEKISKYNYCFALLDGCQSYAEQLAELTLLITLTEGIIVVDDIWIESTTDAVKDILKQNREWSLIKEKGIREGYIVKGSL